MASFSKVRAGVLGVGVLILAGCSEDPQLSTLQQRVFDLKDQLATSIASQAKATAAQQRLQAEIAVLKSNRDATDASARGETAAAQEALEAMRAELATTRATAAQAQASGAAAQAQVSALRGELDGAAAQARALASALEIEATDEIELSALLDTFKAAYMAAAEAARTATDNETATIKTLTEYIKHLKAANSTQQTLRRKLQGVAQMRDAMRDGWQAERARAKNSADGLMAQIDSLTMQLATESRINESVVARADLLELQRDDHAAKLAAATADFETRLAGIRTVEAQFAALKADNAELLDTKEAQLRKLQRMSEAQDYLYQLFESKSLGLRETQGKLKDAQKASDELAAGLADTAAERDALKTEHDALLKERDELRTEVAALNYEMAELNSALTTEERAYDRVNNRAHAATAKVTSLRQALAEAKANAAQQVEFVTAELHAAKAQGESASNAAAVDTKALTQANARAQEAETLLAPMTMQRDQLLEMLTAANARIEALEAKLKP